MSKSQATALRALQRAAFFAGIATAAHDGPAERRLALQARAHEGDDARLLAGGQAREVNLDLPASA